MVVMRAAIMWGTETAGGKDAEYKNAKLAGCGGADCEAMGSMGVVRPRISGVRAAGFSGISVKILLQRRV